MGIKMQDLGIRARRRGGHRAFLWLLLCLCVMALAGCGARNTSAEAQGAGSGVVKTIENKGSDTLVNLALAWAEST